MCIHVCVGMLSREMAGRLLQGRLCLAGRLVLSLQPGDDV